MLHGARQTSEHGEELSLLPDEAAALISPGSALEMAAVRLQHAVQRMESLVRALPDSPAAPSFESTLAAEQQHALHADNARLTEWVTQLEEENVRLTDQLVDMRNQNQAVSQQVLSLSARLEALISRLAKLLEE